MQDASRATTGGDYDDHTQTRLAMTMSDTPQHERKPRGPQVVVMGVSGSGKSTIGLLVADALGVPFVDGDSLHPKSNIAKMAAGTPLTDEDRWPWLQRVGTEVAAAEGSGIVVACSALKRAYRDVIRTEAPEAIFLHLDGSKSVLARRLEGRSDHFMPVSLLDSQLSTLQRLEPDEHGIVVDIAAPVDRVVQDAVAGIRVGVTVRSRRPRRVD
jgi:carbohydrate kinase (thermoresistant glucokinase family)